MFKSLTKHKITPKHAPNASPSDPPSPKGPTNPISVGFPIELSTDVPTVPLKEPLIDLKGF